MKKKILLTGASGKIGKELYNKLKKFNCYGTYFKKKIKKNKKLIKIDLQNKKKVRILINKIKPDIIIHLAGMKNPDLNEKYPKKSKSLNLNITKNLIDSLNSKTHFIFFSTDKVYGGSKKKYNEKSKILPIGTYGKYKFMCENLVKKKFIKHHIFRISLVHFNGVDKDFSVIDKSLFYLKKGSKVELFSNIKRCFVNLDDLINFIPLTLRNNKYGIYNIGSNLLSYVERVKKISIKRKIKFKNNLIEITGFIKPSIMNLECKKLNKNFRYKFT